MKNREGRINYKDYIGKQINYLNILSIDENNNKNYICKCICGEIKKINKYKIVRGELKSCGCMKNVISSETIKREPLEIREKINSLTIIGDMHDYNISDGNRRIRMVIFRCDCGNYAVKDLYRVREGKIKTCGCSRNDISKHPLYNCWN